MALLAIAACVAAYRLGVMALLERVLPVGETALTVLRRVGVIASLFAGYWLVARYYERRRLDELAFPPAAVFVSALAGAALIGATIVVLFAIGNYQVVAYRGWGAAWPLMASIVIAVVIEEVVFRGVLFRLLEQHTGTVRALIVQAVFFGALHVFNSDTTAMTVLSVTLLGAFWALIFVRTRSLWTSIANHAMWNLTIFVSGVPLSGQESWRSAAPWESVVQGPVWLTGGGFGPEDSVINVVVMACVVAALAYRARRRGGLAVEADGGGVERRLRKPEGADAPDLGPT